MHERAAMTKFRQLALAAWALATGVVTVLAVLPIEYLHIQVREVFTAYTSGCVPYSPSCVIKISMVES